MTKDSQSQFSSEDEFVQLLKEKFPATSDPSIVMAIGDDCALTFAGKDALTVTTTDTLAQDIHFSLKYNDPFTLGKKSLSVSLSDIASMGAAPKHLLLSLSLPKTVTKQWLTSFLDGLKSSCDAYKVNLIGGNTTGSTDKIVITTTLLGEVTPGFELLRSTAKDGDTIFVTGYTGLSYLGFKLLQNFSKEEAIGKAPDSVNRHLDPKARVMFGKELGENKLARSMTDISDGLLGDLRHLLNDSSGDPSNDGESLGATIKIADLPMPIEVSTHLESKFITIEEILTGGEEYELLFTAPPGNAGKINDLALKLGEKVTAIGKINSSGDLTVLDSKVKPVEVKNMSFDHFK